jgi:signal transduction histidine kinase
VRLQARRREAELEIAVIDEGIGIAEEALPRVFEKFFRARSSTESGIEGSGLGLVIAREAAEMHGGRIELESRLAEGSTFRVVLPIASPPDDEEPAAA